MKRVIGAAALLLAGAVGPVSAADFYGAGGYGRGGQYGGYHRHPGRAAYWAPEESAYGQPRFFRGRALVEVEPGLIVEYRPPYIGRGLVYNVPPDLYAWRHRYGGVVTARY